MAPKNVLGRSPIKKRGAASRVKWPRTSRFVPSRLDPRPVPSDIEIARPPLRPPRIAASRIRPEELNCTFVGPM
jgi:hypothetical protein